MSTESNPYDAFNAINDARREAREHTDAMTSQIRVEAREGRAHTAESVEKIRSEMRADRSEILSVLNSMNQTMTDAKVELAEVRTGLNMLKWFILAGFGAAGIIAAIVGILVS